MKPLCIDLFCGLGGWAEGFLAEGYSVVGFDIERHDYGSGGYPGQLVLQDVLTLDGRQFRDAAVIVASPPCQKYSYMAMPWKRGKELAAWYRHSPAKLRMLNEVFDACFRIAREAGVPLVVENVKGAQPWVGRAKWHYGSFYLWGDVPALMPATLDRKIKASCSARKWNDREIKRVCNAPNVSRQSARKAASAQIAKIPFPLAQWIAKCYKPDEAGSMAKALLVA